MKRIVCVGLCFLLAVTLAVPALALSSGSFLYGGYDVTGDTLSCYGTALPPGGAASVSCQGQTLSSSLSTIREAQIPVTVYCLVDSASSLTETMMQQEQDVLLAISSRLHTGDTMVLSTIDAAFCQSEPLLEPESRKNAITSISRGNWRTDLYLGVDQALDSLATNTAYHTNRALVILTDGHDDNTGTVKAEELQKKIQTARIPVYTVLLGTGKPNATNQEMENLNAFCRGSVGGFLSSLPTDQNLTPAKAGEQIFESIQNSCVITLDVRELPEKSDLELLVRWDVESSRFEDTILIRALDLPDLPVPEETEPTETQVPEETELEPKSESKANWGLIGGIAAGVLLLAAALGILFYRRVKAEKAAAEQETDQSQNPMPELFSEPTHISVDETEIPHTEPVESVTELVKPTPAPEEPRDCHVTLVAILHPEQRCALWLTTGAEKTLGRDARADVVLNGQDKQLSGCHMALLWDGKHLLLRDNGSTNGTALNGTLCKGNTWYLLSNGDTIRAGACEYRGNYEVNQQGK